MESENREFHGIGRGDTGLRVLLTALFVVVGSVLDSILGVIVVFALLYALITRQPPSLRVRQFANRIIAYYYRIRRYTTYNESALPFPFSDFPEELEPPGSPHEETDRDLKELLSPEHEDESLRHA
jgi:hypothetical protein